ncbi:MAG: glycoside hydrolase family 3 C-terminal domain-containing protein, partial [Kiritimatiellia bacterium]|nr:glycoside hydrolase family 3 C-terminal domain-containing protein [Kiritimatiellia bacterium]MDP7022777.1 glycoside hydrolase family 3 C-terminal domain-containing protein [Kiritimatiellia bacterium]
IGKRGLSQLGWVVRSLSPRDGARFSNAAQKFAREETRLGIPFIIHDEALHGLMAEGSTSFPQAIAMASSWDPDMMHRISVAIGKETVCRGINQVLSPAMDIARDQRCGRVEETYGEDPFLSARMAFAFVKGVQSQGVAATPKHYVANFVGAGGRDSHEVHLSERILREIYFPPFEAAIKDAGALSLMAAYNAVDGEPCVSNAWLLKDVLRGEWGFRGMVVSDYEALKFTHLKHRTASDMAEAGKKAIEAGLDVEMPGKDAVTAMLPLAEEGRVSMEAIDEAVRNVLRVKFQLGLFDNPYVDPAEAAGVCDCAEHRELALEAARKGIVLLRNQPDTLPLSRTAKSIAVIGPNAKQAQLGGYSGSGIRLVSPLQGIRKRAGKKMKVSFSEGCKIKDDSRAGFSRAVSAAAQADVAVLCMGNTSDTEGEDKDRCNLDLPGVQEELILAVAATGTPVIVVLINGSAITMGRWLDKVHAVVEAWYPGEEGGTAIADVLFGDCNPSGRLPVTFPKTASQLPLYYNAKPSGRCDDYVDLRGPQALFPFGFGLSYTTFKYTNLKITPGTIAPMGRVTVSVDVRNTGKRKGDEVVQLYLSDLYASVSRPIKELKGFQRLTLKPGQKQRVSFQLGEKELRMLDRNMNWVVEPGEFEVLVGGDSQTGLRATFKVR